MIRYESVSVALNFSLSIITPIILPVYLHSILFEKLFQKKKYYLYGILTLLIVLIFGYINRLLLELYAEGDSETYFTLVFFMAMFTGFKYLKIGTKQQFQLQEEEAKRIKAELDLLKSQVNPHFMFNTLNNIYSLILDKNDKAGEAVLKLSGLMRYLLDSGKQKQVSLKQECDFIENYIALEKIRLDNRCRISFNIEGDISVKSIAPLLLIPFVENSFKHGISADAEANFIDIYLNVDKGKITFSVENKVALKKNLLQDKQDKSGIKNVKHRLELLYAEKHTLHIAQNNKIHKIKLEIDI